jgi:hypothetical protein
LKILHLKELMEESTTLPRQFGLRSSTFSKGLFFGSWGLHLSAKSIAMFKGLSKAAADGHAMGDRMFISPADLMMSRIKQVRGPETQ